MWVKICGLTNLADARAAWEAGADFLGFVLYARSPRAITPARLRRLADRLPPEVRRIGVFVNERPERVARLAADCGLYAAQLHGDEAAADYRGVGVPLWRAVRLRGRTPSPEPAQWPAACYVVEAYVPGQYGGTGVRANWSAAAALARRCTLLLAGGLTPDNVAAAIRKVRPAGVDVSGGVERTPGKKDWRKVEAFIRAARNI